VPEFEERRAAQFNGYTWRQWLELPYEERVDGIAYLRLEREIELHQEDARASAVRRQHKIAAGAR